LATRRSTNQRSTRSKRTSSKQATSELVPVGGLWPRESEKAGEYFMGSIGVTEDPREDSEWGGTTDLSRLKDVIETLKDGQGLSVFAFYNEGHEENEKQPEYRLYVSPYEEGGNGRRGSRRGRK